MSTLENQPPGDTTVEQQYQALELAYQRLLQEHQQLQIAHEALAQQVADQSAVLQANEHRLQLALAGTQACLWDWDLRTGQLIWSPETFRLHGLDPAMGFPNYEGWYDTLLHPDDRAWVHESVAQALAQRLPTIQLEFRILHPQLGVRWLLSWGHLTVNEQGEAIRLSGINLDISDRKQLERSLQDSEEKLSNILNNAIVAVSSFRLYADRDWEYEYWSAGCEKLFGYPLEAYADKHFWLSQVIPDDLEQVIIPLFDDFFAERDATAEYRFRRKDGEIHWFSSSYSSRKVSDNCWIVTAVNHNITSRKRAELEIRRFVSLADSSSEFIGMCDINFIPFYVNAAGIQLLGIDGPEAYCKTPVKEFFFPEDQDFIINEFFPRVLREGQAEVEIRFRHFKTGEALWMVYSVSYIRDENGQPIGLATISRNITDRKQAEIALRDSEQQFRNMANHAPVMVWVTDPTGYCSFLSQSWYEFTGQTESIGLGYGWLEAVHPDDRQRSAQIFATANEHQSPFRLEYRLRRFDGQYHWAIDAASPWFGVDGQFKGYIGSVIDIEERKQIEQALRESEQRLQAILDHSPAVIYLIDTQNRHLLVNRSYSDLLATTPDAIIGKSIYEIWPTEVADVFAANNCTVIKTGERLQTEELVVLPDGIHSYITVKFPLYEATGIPYAICGISTDITDKKQLETQFYRAQRLESLGTLASGIAHDLNNILTPIIAIAQLLQLKPSFLNARSREMLQMLEDSAKRGAKMIKQILTFTRGTEGEISSIRIASLLQDIIKILQETFPKEITIRAQIPDAPWSVTANTTALHQVLMNLCVNARDAMPNGGTLSLSVQQCSVDQSVSEKNLDAQVGDYVMITIADTGTGIPLEIRDRIFEPFFTTKPQGQGTGLGLATVLGIVKNYGGFLQLTSEVGHGTQIEVYLPLIEAKPIPIAQRSAQAVGQGELILVVDDEVAIQYSLQAMLESHHYTVIAANDGNGAIDLYTQNKDAIKVVILDIMMPNMSGFTLIERLQAINSQVKIIAISGLPANRELAITKGAHAFLSKPYTMERLLQTIQALILQVGD